jgi:hypothetical protein
LERDEPELARTLKQLALASWILFRLSGYARFDFRVDPTGAPFVIDVNPNPFLSPDAGFAAAAAEAGLSYQDLIGSIVESSLGVPQASPICFATGDCVNRASDDHASTSRLRRACALITPRVCKSRTAKNEA